MPDKYQIGQWVAWDWGNGSAKGKVQDSFAQKVTRTIEGTEVTRDADEDNPAYMLEQDDGSRVLKSHSELRDAEPPSR